MGWLRRTTRSAFADRKGATAIEYALIAAGAATVVATSYDVFFYRMANYLSSISFPA